MKIAFYARGEFDGLSINEALGGTESSVIFLSKELAKLGNDVTVFSNCKRPGKYSGVAYKDTLDFSGSFDVLVAVREFEILKDADSMLKIIWLHDAPDQPVIQTQIHDWPLADRLFTVSRWQAERYAEHFVIPREKFFITRNGVNRPDFQNLPKKNPNKLIYLSAAYRGLDILLEIFPEIKKIFPDTSLSVCSYFEGKQKNLEGVNFLGRLRRSEMLRELQKSYIMTYTNTFHETSCIAAMEAQASGTPVIASKLAALPETVSGGMLIDGDPKSEDYKEKFLSAILELIESKEKWLELSKKGREFILKNNTWDIIAKEWLEEFNSL